MEGKGRKILRRVMKVPVTFWGCRKTNKEGKQVMKEREREMK